MTSSLSADQKRLMQEAVDAGDRIAYWSILAVTGDSYGALSLGVANFETLAGLTANL
jgi:hypothetical protein